MPFISCPNIHFCLKLTILQAAYFMSGVRPIEMNELLQKNTEKTAEIVDRMRISMYNLHYM